MLFYQTKVFDKIDIVDGNPASCIRELDVTLYLGPNGDSDVTYPIVGSFTLRKINKHLWYSCKVEIVEKFRGKGYYKELAELRDKLAKEEGAKVLFCTVLFENMKHFSRLTLNKWEVLYSLHNSFLMMKRLTHD